jgi:NAD(P)-dependent dehydrogenase (short-subunit alcohol dehydrogenase family)
VSTDGLHDKTYLVTGANTGIGRATARALATRGATVVLACRSAARTQPVIDAIATETGAGERLRFLALDLGDLGSVRAAADAFLAGGQPLHGLINNAGLAGRRGLTDSGFELAFGTNYVGHFLLTSLLLGRLGQSAPARVVNVSSDAHRSATGIDWDAVRRPTQTRTGMREYSVSKLANVLHAQELARRLDGDGVTTYALHPGVIASDIWRPVPWPIRPLLKLRMKSTDEGAHTTLYCATSPDVANESGRYYDDSKPTQPGPGATPAIAAELWSRSEAWLNRS